MGQPPTTESPSTGEQEVFLWIQLLAHHLERLERRLTTFRAVDNLRVVGFEDPKSTATLVCLRFRSNGAEKTELCRWAEQAGFQVIDIASWSASRRRDFATAVSRFRCSSFRTQSLALALCARLCRANSEALWRRHMQTPLSELSNGVPKTVEVSESVRHEVVVHEFAGPRLYPRAQTTEL